MHQDIDNIVKRIVQSAKPTRIILYGSHARGEAKSDSDIDLLVVVESTKSRRLVMALLYEELADCHYPIDIAVVTESDIQKYGKVNAGLIRPAINEGRTIYAV